MRRTVSPRRFCLFLPLNGLVLWLWAFGQLALAQEQHEAYSPDRYSVGLTVGQTFDPVDDIGFLLLTGSGIFDYGKVWRHPAPAPMRFKVEATVGGSYAPDVDLMASAGMLALYFLEPISGGGFHPYVEGGIGLIYTQHRVEDQGTNLNLNPQIGMGTEFKFKGGPTYFAAVRWHHLSNGGLVSQNRGVNSIVLVLGRFLW